MSWNPFQGGRGEPLVTRRSLEKLLDEVEALEPYRLFMANRWIGMVMWWHERSVGARQKYFLLRAIVVVGGVSIPVLTTLSLLGGGWHTPTAVAIALVGAVVAGCAAWEGIANYGETWREKRRAAELLKVEGWQFIQLCGKYESLKTADLTTSYQLAYPRFAADVEALIAREIGEYLAMFDPSLEQAKQAASDVMTAITEETVKRAKTL